MSATEKKLGELHGIVADALIDRIAVENEGLDDGLTPNASTITAAIQFLKHNEIVCTPDAPEMNALAGLIKKKRAADIPHDEVH